MTGFFIVWVSLKTNRLNNMRGIKVKKLFLALVGIVVITVILAGCGGNAATSSIKPVSPSTSTAIATQPATSAASITTSATTTTVSVPATVAPPPSSSAAPAPPPAQGTQPPPANNKTPKPGGPPAATSTLSGIGTPAVAATAAASATPAVVPVTSTTLNNKAFPGNVLLGKPTADSITLSLLASATSDLFIQYGKKTNQYDVQTDVAILQKDQTLAIKLTGLTKATQYYYRICHKTSADTAFNAGNEGTFVTQRQPGESFVFTVDADPHFDTGTDPAKVKLVFQNILNEHPDFDIGLGDTFMSEKLAPKNYQEMAGIYLDRRNTFSVFGGSVPLLMVLGNHDSTTTSDNQARDAYFPTVSPDSFYSGSRSYYAWEWGNSLFVVLDPYTYTNMKGAAGWDWTLGKAQYDWLKATLEKSQAKYKFVFSHHLVGGNNLGSGGNGRGGVEVAKFYEWGGQNEDGSFGFDTKRPGWGKPIHQLLVDNHVTIFFHGHDHFFGRQELDGVIYQECPQPGSGGDNTKAKNFGYLDGVIMPSPGHVCVSVSDGSVKVDYIKVYLPGQEPAGHPNGEVAYTYTLPVGQPGAK